MVKFTVNQLQDLLRSVRLRRDLDIPGEARDEAGVSGTTQTRTLVDFKLPYFKKWKWPADQPIPYMFDSNHSKSKFKKNSRLIC